MTEASQSIEEIVTYTKRKWEYFATDAPTSERSKEPSDKSEIQPDNALYAGGFRGYRSDKGKNVEPYYETLRRMAKQSQRFNAGNAQQHSDVQRQPPLQNYNFERDTAGNSGSRVPTYSGSFEDVAKQYLTTEGKEFYAFQKSKGRDFYNITRIETADLESIADGAIAALENDGNEATLLGSYNFDAKAEQFADHYGVSKDRAITYLLTHELAHASAKGIGFDDHIQSEKYVENTLHEYFTAKGDYDLANIASDRAANVMQNYGSLDSVGTSVN